MRALAGTVDAMPRTSILVTAGAIVLAACTGGSDDAALIPTTAPSTTAPVDGDAVVGPAERDASLTAADEAALAAEVAQQWSVSIDVVAEGFEAGSVEASVGWTGDPDDVVDDGPFGAFGSCAGLRDDVAAYSVFVSGDEASGVDDVAVWAASRVAGAGIYDAEVRIEQAGFAPLMATGTMTILDGLQQGAFLAFGADGGRIEGTFSCSGTEPPSPLASGGGAAASDAVEVFAVLRNGDAERFVGLTDASDAAVCGGEGVGGVLLRVDGDASTGAITAIELDSGPPTSARLRVAGVDYEFAQVTVVLDEGPGVSGVFSAATIDGLSVDGAFRCT